jgi:hypothetical protein
MATGRLAAPVQLGSGNTTVYIVPTGYYSVFNISLTNTSASAVTVKLSLSAGVTPNAQDAIEQQTTIVGYGVFERTGLVLQAGYYVVASASVGATINAVVYGIETSTS